MTAFRLGLVIAAGTIAIACDLRTRRIPNALTFGIAAIAVVAAFIEAGAGGAGRALGGWIAGGGLFLPLFLVGGMGAGDVKLLAAFGAILGPRGAAWTAVLASLAGGVLATTAALQRAYLRQALANLGSILAVWKTVGPMPIDGLTLRDARGPRLPYAIAIACGAWLAVWLGKT